MNEEPSLILWSMASPWHLRFRDATAVAESGCFKGCKVRQPLTLRLRQSGTWRMLTRKRGQGRATGLDSDSGPGADPVYSLSLSFSAGWRG